MFKNTQGRKVNWFACTLFLVLVCTSAGALTNGHVALWVTILLFIPAVTSLLGIIGIMLIDFLLSTEADRNSID